VLIALFLPLAAAAQNRLRVNVELRNCNELSQPEVRRVLLAELSAHLTEDRASDVTRIIVECNGPRAVLRVGDPLSRKVVQRTIDLGASEPKARGRLLALATAELVVASWTELETNPNPKVEPAGPRPPATVRAAARQVVQKRARLLPAGPPASTPPPAAEVPPEEPAPRPAVTTPYSERWPDPQNWGIDEPTPERGFRIMAVASARSFFAHEGALWGGGLRIAEERFKTVGWSLDALLESGEVTTTDARFRVTTTTFGAGINLYRRWQWLAVRGGGGVRMGFASAENLDLPDVASSALTPWGWPLGSIGLSVYRSRAVLELLGEAGYVVLPVRGGTPALRGPWFSVQMAVGVMP
jgi:hypothetical protein